MQYRDAKDAAGVAQGGDGFPVDLDERSREIFRQIVETFLSTGDPVGSRNISRQLPMPLSPASVRNVMADLESLGLIYAPHTSAGRLPTETGLRLFVDALLEVGDLSDHERAQIKGQISGSPQDMAIEDVLTEAGEMLSGLSRCAGVVLAEQQMQSVKHIEFVRLDARRSMVVLVGEDGLVENRIIQLPEGLPASALTEATNYINSRISGRSLADVREETTLQEKTQKAELDALTAKVVQAGLAVWSGDEGEQKNLIVRGRSHLLEDLHAMDDIERIRLLFDDLEAKRDIIQLLGLAEGGEGVKIFIGSENQLFSMSGSSLVVAPFHDSAQKIVGVLGVIGPTRLNYARIIPMVDYTAKLVGRMLT